MSMVATIEAGRPGAFQQDFPERPFAIRHGFAGHPLFTLPKIIDLLREMPRDQLEFNSGKVGIAQDPDAMPLLDMRPEEIVRRIETAGAWMVLKRVEVVPAYRAVLEEALLAVARAQGHPSLNAAGFHDIRGFMFVSSPRSTTPFHLDGEDNVFVQIHGEKFFTIFDNRDGGIASDSAVEHAITKHRNLHYTPEFESRATCHTLNGGDGVFVPYLWPHYVKTGDNYSISLAITWKTRAVIRNNDLITGNAWLRRQGLPQASPGVRPMLDALKAAAFGVIRVTLEPLRKSETLRNLLRKAVLGRGADYYLKPAKKPGM